MVEGVLVDLTPKCLRSQVYQGHSPGNGAQYADIQLQILPHMHAPAGLKESGRKRRPKDVAQTSRTLSSEWIANPWHHSHRPHRQWWNIRVTLKSVTNEMSPVLLQVSWQLKLRIMQMFRLFTYRIELTAEVGAGRSDLHEADSSDILWRLKPHPITENNMMQILKFPANEHLRPCAPTNMYLAVTANRVSKWTKIRIFSVSYLFSWPGLVRESFVVLLRLGGESEWESQYLLDGLIRGPTKRRFQPTNVSAWIHERERPIYERISWLLLTRKEGDSAFQMTESIHVKMDAALGWQTYLLRREEDVRWIHFCYRVPG